MRIWGKNVYIAMLRTLDDFEITLGPSRELLEDGSHAC
jgi:hypothetical protein